MEDSKLENVIRKLAIAFGGALLIFSIYLSYDGFDQSVTGGNSNYTILAQGIGFSIAITFTILEFIFSARHESLNTTLRALGLFAYGYSIYTNYLGAQHLLQMDKGMAVVVALFMDIVPEPMIAWGLGEALVGDLFGNIGKFATAPIAPKKQNQQGQQQTHNQNHQNNQNNKVGRDGGDRRQNNQPVSREKRIEELRVKYPFPGGEKKPNNNGFHAVNRENRGNSGDSRG